MSKSESGKTTFIMKAAETLIKRGEKIVVIENEIGEAGIDTELLSGDGYRVFELLNGCICCTLKSDFEAAFVQINERIRPDRVLIEPSGIFVLDSLFDILQSPSLRDNYALCSVLTVIDARHFLRHEENYPEFLKNQVENASSLLLTKTEGLRDLAMDYILQKLEAMNDEAEIIKDYRGLSDAALVKLMEPEAHDAAEEVCPHCGHAHSHDEHDEHEHAHDEHEGHEHAHDEHDEHEHMHDGECGHHDHDHAHDHGRDCHAEGHEHVHIAHTVFETLMIKPKSVYDKEELQNKLNLLSSGEYGTILRAKGFVKSEKGYFAVNYVDGDVGIAVKLRTVPVALQFIGLGLKTEQIGRLFR